MTLRFLFYFKVYPLFILFPKIRIYQSNYLLHHITAGYYSTIIFSTLIACKSRIKSLNISRLTSSRKKKLPLHFHYLECFIYLPRFPDIRLISKSGLFSVTDHRCLNHLRVFQSTICLGNRIEFTLAQSRLPARSVRSTSSTGRHSPFFFHIMELNPYILWLLELYFIFNSTNLNFQISLCK